MSRHFFPSLRKIKFGPNLLFCIQWAEVATRGSCSINFQKEQLSNLKNFHPQPCLKVIIYLPSAILFISCTAIYSLIIHLIDSGNLSNLHVKLSSDICLNNGLQCLQFMTTKLGSNIYFDQNLMGAVRYTFIIELSLKNS